MFAGQKRIGSLIVIGVTAALVAVAFILAFSVPAAAGPETVIAWNPSHQDDTGYDDWHEYLVCEDITKRAMALLPDFTNILCWETGMGLTSSNRPALASEVDQANAAGAHVFISVHVDGGAPSGILGCYCPGDSSSALYAGALARSIAATMSMRYRGLYASSAYVLDPAYNRAPVRVLLELGDNVADRALLESGQGRQRMAAALAQAVRDNTPPSTRYQQNDTRLGYEGTWTASSSDYATGGSFRFADASGASVTASFTGTSLAWIAKKSPSYGKASVSVDGGEPVLVDLYSTSTVWRQKVWETGRLSPGPHVVRIEWTGVRSVSSGGTHVNVDAFDVVGTLTQAPSPEPSTNRYQQTSPLIAYVGRWLTFSTSGASGGTYTYTDAPASATISFSGTQLDWIATKGVTQGRARVSLDGGEPVSVDLYNPTVLRQVKVWSTGLVEAGTHTLTFTWTGEGGVTGGGTRVNIDALDVLGTLVQASAPPPSAPSPIRYEQADPHFDYTGTWATFSTAGASAGSYKRANTEGASVTVQFIGTYLAWIATRGTTLGKAFVSLDGGPAESVDLGASKVAYQQKVWTTGDLTGGAHTVRIWWDPANLVGKYISIDAFEVLGTLD